MRWNQSSLSLQTPSNQPEIEAVIAPILLPVFALMSSLFGATTPILEWSAAPMADQPGHHLTIKILTLEPSDLCQVLIAPADNSKSIPVEAKQTNASKTWEKARVWHWMWEDSPSTLEIELDVEHLNAEELLVSWDQVHSGQRRRASLGSIRLEASSEVNCDLSDASTDPLAVRKATPISQHAAEVHLEISGFPKGAFLKWTEFVPEGCTCRVSDDGNSALRSTTNSEILIWFQAPEQESIATTYELNCPNLDLHDLPFDGTLEWAFGSEGNLTHIAGVEWQEETLAASENMRLNQSPDAQGVAPISRAKPSRGAQASGIPNLHYAVQILANHRDVDGGVLEDELGYRDRFHIVRHDGWHKYLTDEVSSYSEARNLRSTLWETTKVTDAFVTASFEGQRISVQEALLMSNETWMP